MHLKIPATATTPVPGSLCQREDAQAQASHPPGSTPPTHTPAHSHIQTLMPTHPHTYTHMHAYMPTWQPLATLCPVVRLPHRSSPPLAGHPQVWRVGPCQTSAASYLDVNMKQNME